jgi:hypothetical protein
MKIFFILIFSVLLSSNSCNKEKTTESKPKKEETTAVVATNINTETKPEDAPQKMEEKTQDIAIQEPAQLKGITINYEAITRGYQLFTTIKDGKFMVKHGAGNEELEIKITTENWTKIANLYSKIDLVELTKLFGSTKERMHDGRAHGNLSITKNNKVYSTQGFDHGVPPAKIKEIVDLIVSLSAKKEE